MSWIIPFLLWLALIMLAAWRDISRIQSNLEYTYQLSTKVARRYALIIAGAIYIPAYAFLVLATWLLKTHQIGTFGIAALCLLGPLWWFLGYALTGGRANA
jgi:hypothetical protein